MCILDTKYKRSAEPEASDIEQIVAYAVKMKAKNAFLVYPSRTTKQVSISINEEITVWVSVFDISLDPDQAGTDFVSWLLPKLGAWQE